MSQITCMAGPLSKPFAGERQGMGQRPSSAHCINGNRHSEKALQSRPLAGQSFATPNVATASATTAGPARCRIRSKFPRDRTRADAYAARGGPAFLHIWATEKLVCL
jgi:hypothetical protein